MTLSSKKITAFTNLIASLADQPTGLTSTQLKAYWDSSPEELRLALNGVIDILLSTTPGDSGSENIGSPTISGVSGDTVYEQLAALKTLIDVTAVGQIPDGSLTNAKLATDIKVGSLAALATSDKSALVNAINELVSGKIAKSLLTAQGDIIYASSASTPASLAKGTAGQVLQMKSDGTQPEWGDGVALVKIAEVTLGANAASISFSSIPQTYKHIILKGSIRSTVAGQLDDVLVRFNSDSSAIYQQHYIGGNGGTVTDYDAVSQTSIKAGRSAGNTATANFFTPIEILIPDYASSKAKSLLFQSLAFFGTSPSSQTSFTGGGFTTATSAISSLIIFNTALLMAGSTFTLYGVK